MPSLVSSHIQYAIPTSTFAEINAKTHGKAAGSYVSETDLLYFVESSAGITVQKAKITAANSFKGKDIRLLTINAPALKPETDNAIGPELKSWFSNNIGVPMEIIKKMTLADFARTRFLATKDGGQMQDLTMEELQQVLAGEETSAKIDAIIFPVNGIFYGAVLDGGGAKELAKFMRGEDYTGKEFEIYTPQGKIKTGNEVFKPFLQKFLEKFSTLFFSVSAAFISAATTQIIAASVAAGVLTVACPPLIFVFIGIAIGLVIIGALLLFIASRVENTVNLPSQQPHQIQQGQHQQNDN
ncbi:MAG: hypothetical protein LBD72_01895 [Puniceicoccales bacterium]|jgi:hypothetical protein|nr:hypothetical protein [Puniceicoccales bacterium]